VHGFLRLIIDTLPLEIEVTRRENWDPMNRFNEQMLVKCIFMCIMKSKLKK
jgi:hypothetical protein